MFAMGLRTHIAKVTFGKILSGLPKVTAKYLKYAMHMVDECSKMKEGITRMRFIHLNKVDHQSDVAAELLVKQRRDCREEKGSPLQTQHHSPE